MKTSCKYIDLWLGVGIEVLLFGISIENLYV